jgi:integrase
MVNTGQDPLGVLQTLRTSPTISDLCDRFVAEHLPKKRPTTQQAYASMIDKCIKPALGSRKVVDVAFADIVKILTAIRAAALDEQVWVFPLRPASSEHRGSIEGPWNNIRKIAQLPNIRIHDLRHTFASLAISDGASLPTVGALLGHTVPTTTARYAHLLDDPLRRVAERVGAMLSPGLPTGGKHGER